MIFNNSYHCPLYRTATLILGAAFCSPAANANEGLAGIQARPPLVEPPFCKSGASIQSRPPLPKPPYCSPASDMAPKLASPTTRASGLPVISDNGRYVAYITNIVRQHGEQQRDQIFLWDNQTQRRHLISQDNEKDPDKQGEGNSLYPAISGDGSRVIYASDARDIDPDCADGQMNIYLRIWDQMKTSDCLSKARNGSQANGSSLYPSISGDGLSVSWSSNAGNFVDPKGVTLEWTAVWVWTNDQGIRLVSVAHDGGRANAHSGSSQLDQNGQHITFTSEASNLTVGDTNDQPDIFVRTLNAGNPALEKTELVSVGVDGKPANAKSAGSAISRDGLKIAFVSAASNLVEGDTNGKRDIFVRDLSDPDHPVTERVSLSSDGQPANGDSDAVSITRDGRCVAFQSYATSLVAGDNNASTDAFVHDRQTGRTERVSRERKGKEANNDSFFPVISADGSTVAFTSTATHLASGSDRKDDPDVYVAQLPDGLCH